MPEGYIPALRPKTVADEIVDKVSDGDTDAFSDMLEVEQSDKVITSGDALRLLENSKLKITPASGFYKSINSAFQVDCITTKMLSSHTLKTSLLFRQFNGDYYAIWCQQLNRKAFDIRNGI